MNWELVAFAFLAAGVLYTGYQVVTTPIITHAAFYLAACFVGIAGLFLMLKADFLAAVQILVYVGAVMTVVIFAIMLSNVSDIKGNAQRGLVQSLVSPRLGFLPVVVVAAVAALLLWAYAQARFPEQPLAQLPGPVSAGGGTTAEIGQALFTVYLVPFEVASLLLLAAMVGAIILTWRGESK